ncbi:MAG: hypothetical protein GEU91_19665 [Rhizobiales bacterium]|nr:hypothetical protein [Hyphomicrobiales bacterium]
MSIVAEIGGSPFIGGAMARPTGGVLLVNGYLLLVEIPDWRERVGPLARRQLPAGEYRHT